jgi:hypothetical protein
MLHLLTFAFGAGLFAMLVWTAIASWLEHEHRAAGRAAGLALVLPLPYAAAGLLPSP